MMTWIVALSFLSFLNGMAIASAEEPKSSTTGLESFCGSFSNRGEMIENPKLRAGYLYNKPQEGNIRAITVTMDTQVGSSENLDWPTQLRRCVCIEGTVTTTLVPKDANDKSQGTEAFAKFASIAVVKKIHSSFCTKQGLDKVMD